MELLKIYSSKAGRDGPVEESRVLMRGRESGCEVAVKNDTGSGRTESGSHSPEPLENLVEGAIEIPEKVL